MRGVGDYIVVYDISENRERRKVDKLLKGYGFRIQKSVFEVRTDKKGRRKLERDLNALKIETGFIRIYRLEYTTKPGTIGNDPGGGKDDEYAFIV